MSDLFKYLSVANLQVFSNPLLCRSCCVPSSAGVVGVHRYFSLVNGFAVISSGGDDGVCTLCGSSVMIKHELVL